MEFIGCGTKFFKPKSMFTCIMTSLTSLSLATHSPKFISGNNKPNYLTHFLNRVKTCLVHKYFMTCTSLKMCYMAESKKNVAITSSYINYSYFSVWEIFVCTSFSLKCGVKIGEKGA